MVIDEIFGDTRPVLAPTKSALYVWGYNQPGQTGRKCKEQNLRIPKQLPPDLFGCLVGANSRCLVVACGRKHIADVASDGSLFTWVTVFPATIKYGVSRVSIFMEERHDGGEQYMGYKDDVGDLAGCAERDLQTRRSRGR
ncbi:hypothetical protein L6452_37992 [Arctium lappa]|uniref:Uncharacterized protein n=1 Tax=Arctium lappa TaxID=4217 RepID=A0ACB8Y5K2_ARCLA|nr:hypothetical protein L6452_37992 [Arctium lappa]